MATPTFWDNPESAKETVGKLKSLKATADPICAVLAKAEDLQAMLDLLAEGDDTEVRGELEDGLTALASRIIAIRDSL